MADPSGPRPDLSNHCTSERCTDTDPQCRLTGDADEWFVVVLLAEAALSEWQHHSSSGFRIRSQ